MDCASSYLTTRIICVSTAQLTNVWSVDCGQTDPACIYTYTGPPSSGLHGFTILSQMRHFVEWLPRIARYTSREAKRE